MKGFNLLMLF